MTELPFAQPGQRLLVKIPLPNPAFFHPKFIRRLRGSGSPFPRQRSHRAKLLRWNRNDVRAFWGKKPPSEGAGTAEAEPPPWYLDPFGNIFGKRSAPIPCPAGPSPPRVGRASPGRPRTRAAPKLPSWSSFGARQLLNLWPLIGLHLPNSS